LRKKAEVGALVVGMGFMVLEWPEISEAVALSNWQFYLPFVQF